jgi:Protein of unknown function C-terminus (DUF2451).
MGLDSRMTTKIQCFQFQTNSLDRVALAEMCVEVDLKKSETLFGLSERVIAVESLVFLSSQFQILHSYLECLLSDQTKNTLHQFYTQVTSSSVKCRPHSNSSA